MINSEVKSNGLGHSGFGMATNRKQPQEAIKKTALRDVQNDNTSLMGNRAEGSILLEGRPIADATKFSGTKRLTQEFPSSNNGTNDYVAYTRRKVESEIGRGRNQDNTGNPVHQKQQKVPQQQTLMRESNMYHVPVVAPNHMAPPITLPYGGTSIPISLGKHVTGLPAADVHHSTEAKTTDDQERNERYLHLQRFLEQCDVSNRRDYMQMLLHLSPADLSRYAVELEKRAIQLTIEEGKEMQRMKTLKIFGKSGSTINPLQTTQPQLSKK